MSASSQSGLYGCWWQHQLLIISRLTDTRHDEWIWAQKTRGFLRLIPPSKQLFLLLLLLSCHSLMEASINDHLSLWSDHIKAGDTVTGLQQQPVMKTRGHPPKNPIDQPPATEGTPINSRAANNQIRLINHRLVFTSELNFTSRVLSLMKGSFCSHNCFNASMFQPYAKKKNYNVLKYIYRNIG